MSCHSIWYPLDTGNYQHWCFRYLSPVTGAPVSAYSPYQKIKISVNPHGTIHWKPNTGHRTNPLPRHRLAEDKQNQLLFPTPWFRIFSSDTFHVPEALLPLTICMLHLFFWLVNTFFEKNFHIRPYQHKKESAPTGQTDSLPIKNQIQNRQQAIKQNK